MREINLGTVTDEEFAAWEAEFEAAVDDGSLRAEIEAKIEADGDPESGPEWKAKYGDASWDAALALFDRMLPPADPS